MRIAQLVMRAKNSLILKDRLKSGDLRFVYKMLTASKLELSRKY